MARGRAARRCGRQQPRSHMLEPRQKLKQQLLLLTGGCFCWAAADGVLRLAPPSPQQPPAAAHLKIMSFYGSNPAAMAGWVNMLGPDEPHVELRLVRP